MSFRAWLILLAFASSAAHGQALWPARTTAPSSLGLQRAAAGDQTNPRLALLPNGHLFTVFLDRRGHPLWPQVSGAIISPANPGAAVPFTITQSNHQLSEPDLACGAQACLVVWGETRAYSSGVVLLQRFGLDGVPVGPMVELSAPSSSSRWSPAVAFLADGSQAIAVWSENEQIVFSRLDAQGAVLQAPTVISRTAGVSNYRPRVAGTGQTFVVVWTHEGQGGYQLRSTTVSPTDGAVGAPMRVLNINTEGSQVPNVVADASRAVLLNLQIRVTSYGTLLAWPLDQSGAPLNALGFALGQGDSHYGRPEVGFDGADWAVLTGWEGQGEFVRAERLDLACSSTSFAGQTTGEGRTAYSLGALAALAPLASANPWLVWMDERGLLDTDLYLAQATLSNFALAPDAGARLFQSAPGQYEPAIAVAPEGFLVAWSESPGPRANNVGLVKVGKDGAPLGPEQIVVDGGRGVRAPALAPSWTGYTLAWLEHQQNWTDLLLMQLGTDGQPLEGSSRRLWSGEYAHPTAPLVVSTRKGTWVLSSSSPEGSRALYGMRTLRDGGWEAEEPRRLLPIPDQAGAPAATASVMRMFVAWQSRGIHGARLSIDGEPLGDDVGAKLSKGEYTSDPAVASNGQDFLLVWAEHDGTEQVNGAVVRGIDGRVSAPINYVGSGETELLWRENTLKPKVAWDGARYVITYNVVTRDGGSDVRYVAVDARGAELERGVIASGPEHELEATVAADPYGRTLVAYTGFVPDAGARRLFTRALAEVGLGYSCLSTTECLVGTCEQALGCCSENGSPCYDPLTTPVKLEVACGCGAAPGGVAGLVLLGVLLRRRRATASPDR